MTKAPVILRDDPEFAHLDFNLLRNEGIEHLAALSGKLWTDHNLHDPGITILEVLCYALTDLGFRNSLPIEDIINAQGNNAEIDNHFFTPAQILSCNPLTILDYRKLLIDVEGVRNAWLEPVENKKILIPNVDKKVKLNGLYRIYLELEKDLTSGLTTKSHHQQVKVNQILERVKETLHQHRNLCEDFEEIILLQDEEIGICATIELLPDANPDEVLYGIAQQMQDFLCPRLNFYSLEQMLDRGKSMEEIFEGRPFLKSSHGFIDVDELADLDLRSELHASDIYREIMKVTGIIAIKGLDLSNFIGGQAQYEQEEWCLRLNKNYRPMFSLKHSSINFSKGVLQFKPNKEKVAEQLGKQLAGLKKSKLPPEKLDVSIPRGVSRPDLADYYSIQHEFPLVYRIGKGELPSNASKQRKIQARQLKGYLLFYDQLLANFLTQLKRAGSLFSMDVAAPENRPSPSQVPENVPELNDLLIGSKNKTAVGAVIATALEKFETQTKAIQKIKELMLLFDNGQEKKEILAIEKDRQYPNHFQIDFKEAELCGQSHKKRFIYLIKNKSNQILLYSQHSFPTAKKAEEAVNLVNFLTISEQNFRITFDQKEESFVLQLIYNPISYSQYLGQIAENEFQYFHRKNLFLDHLLTRFAEDFTDYVLLMYALNGEKLPIEQIARDKVAFLKDYPELSRNRGKAFNYKKTKIWDTNNVSGLEKKVSKLMGLKNFTRSTLGNIELTRRNNLHFLELRDAEGKLLFKTVKGLEKEPTEETKKTFKNNASIKENYQCFDCPEEHVYGFQLTDENGIVIATYPETFGNEAQRNILKDCVFQKIRGDGFLKVFKESTNAFRFLVKGEENEILWKGCIDYPSENAVQLGWYFLFSNIDNIMYYDVLETKSGKYGIFFQRRYKGEWEQLAQYKEVFDSKLEAEQRRDILFEEMRVKKMNYSLPEEDRKYGWRLKNMDGVFDVWSQVKFEEEALQFPFQNEEQTADGFVYFMEQAIQPEQYDISSKSGKHYFVIKGKGDFAIAQSSKFETKKKLEKAKANLIEYLKPILERFNERNRVSKNGYLLHIIPHLNLVSPEDSFSYVLKAPNDSPWLISEHTYPDIQEVKIAFLEFLELACNADNYHDISGEDHCDLGFVVQKEGQIIARHPHFYLDETEKEEVKQEIIEYIQKRKCLVEFTGMWTWEIQEEDCNDLCRPYIQSTHSWITEELAQSFCDEFVIAAKKDFKEVLVESEASFFFNIIPYQSEEELARTIAFPITEENSIGIARDALKAFFEDNKTIELNILELCKDIQPIENVKDLNCPGDGKVKVGYRVLQRGDLIANHPQTYASTIKREQAKKRIFKDSQQKTVPYSLPTISVQVRCIAEVYYLVIRNRQGVLWQSSDCYVNHQKAEEKRMDFFWQVITFSAKGIHYRLKAACIHLLDDKGKEIASIPGTFEGVNALNEEREKRLLIAQNYPLIKRKEGYGFQIFNRITKELDWKSNHWYDSLDHAYGGFNEFLELLVYLPNYLNENKEKAGIYSFGLGQILLEGVDCYEEEFDCEKLEKGEKFSQNLNVWNWRDGVKNFLRHTTETYAYYPFTQYNNGCQHGFRVVDEEYVLARHPNVFKTRKKREQERDKLITWAKCKDDLCSNVEMIVANCQAEAYKLIWKKKEKQETIWQGAKIYLTKKAAEEHLLLLKAFANGRITMTEAKIFRTDQEAENFLLVLEQIEKGLIQCDDVEMIVFMSSPKKFQLTLVKIEAEKNLWKSIQSFPTEDEARSRLDILNGVKKKEALGKEVKICGEEKDICFTKQEIKNLRLAIKQIKEGVINKEDTEIYIDFQTAKNYRLFLKDTESGETLWSGTQIFASLEEADKAKSNGNRKVCWMTNAREGIFYKLLIEEVANKAVRYSAALLDSKDNYLATLPNWYTTVEEAIEAVKVRIDVARKYPFYLYDNKIGFQIYCPETEQVEEIELACPFIPIVGLDVPQETVYRTIEIQGGIIWEGVRLYDTLEAARVTVNKLCPIIGTEQKNNACENRLASNYLLKEAINYERKDQPQCWAYGLEITDPAHVLAEHPRVYSHFGALTHAIEKVKSVINTEGFHLVEHILLRPKQEDANCILSSCPDLSKEIQINKKERAANSCQPVAKEDACEPYLPGADSYSFWATVVLPYWPKRFQNTNFRTLFENKLREESPAHIALRIVWVDPGQMLDFEKTYQNWLYARSREECDHLEAQCEFIDCLQSLNTIFPPAIIEQTEVHSKELVIVLDQTALG